MNFALIIYAAVVLYATAVSVGSLGEGQEYPYFLKGLFIITVVVLGVLLLIFGIFWSRLELSRRIEDKPYFAMFAETVAVLLVVAAGAVLRIAYINSMPMQPESDYKTYYEIAQMIGDGTLLTKGVGYCDYVSMFPHVLGYPAVLSVLFSVFGTGIATAQYFNIVLSLATALIAWRIVRRLAGRIGGFVTLCAAVFWPSQILYINFVAGEYLFTFLLVCCMWLFVDSMKSDGTWKCPVELMLLGLMLAVCGTIRPLALLYLAAVLICLVPLNEKLPARPKNDISLARRLVSRGWRRCLIVLCVYVAFSSFFSMCVGYTVDRKLASGSSSFGYNLLVGLNIESYGGWNQEDADYLYDSFDATGSATEAHLACRDLALERLGTDPKALLDLMVHKFEVLWGNDDYGASWNILFMDQQGTLTPQRESFYYNMMDVSDLYYLVMLVFAGIAGILAWFRKPDASYSFMLLLLATAAMHLFVENQNRYHFHGLTLLAIFAGMAVSGLLAGCNRQVMARKLAQERERAERAERSRKVREAAAQERRLEELREKAMHASFDLESALNEGHVGIIVSEAVREPVSGVDVESAAAHDIQKRENHSNGGAENASEPKSKG